jgi:hypothetical protein
MKYLNKKQQENYIKNYFKEKNINYSFNNDIFEIENNFILSLGKNIHNDDKETFIIYPWNDINKFIEMIIYRLKIKETTRIYARDTNVLIENINKKHREFINENHILECPPFKNKICSVTLYYKDDIIGLGIFTKYRDDVELKRLVFKKGYSVVGGTSKIIKNFNKHFKEYKNIITFSDNNLGNGNVYNKLGFKLIDDVKEQIVWYNPEFNKKFTDVSLVRIGADRLLVWHPQYIPFGIGEDLPNNQEIVKMYGFIPIYDAGYKKWIKEC